MEAWLEYLIGNSLLTIRYGMKYVSASWGWTENDVKWKEMLRERFGAHGDGHEDAKGFWMDLRCLRRFLDLDEKGQDVLKRLSSA